jgi:pimeloyl-ACP methyl ester carboxylesterase
MAQTHFVFLHGGGQGSWVWAETIAALKAQAPGGVSTLALDVPGCGVKRGRDTSAITFEDIARELVGDIERAGLRDVVMVGHSQAGQMIPQMALIAPALFRRLIFVSCIAQTPGLGLMQMMGEGLHGEREDCVGWPRDFTGCSADERWRALFCNDMTDAQADALLPKLGKDAWPASSLAPRDWAREHLGAFASSYVLCLRDESLTPHWQAIFAQRLKADRVISIDAGHQVMNTRPHGLAEILLAEARL